MYKIICLLSALIILCLPIFGSELEIENDIKEFDLNAITTIVTDDDDNMVDFLKQNVNITDENRPLLGFIGKKEDTMLNIYEVLDLYTKSDQIRKKVNIYQVQNLIRQGFGCAVSKVTSLYLFVMLHDLKKLKIDIKSQKEIADEIKEYNEGPTQTEHTEYGGEVALRKELFFEKDYGEDLKPALFKSIHNTTEYKRLGERFGIRSNIDPKDDGPSIPFFVYFVYYSEYLWAGILRKQVIYQINNAVQFEMFKVVFGPGNSDSLMTDDHINDVVCVLEEMLKKVDDEISSQCVDHNRSLVKKYEIFFKVFGDGFTEYLSGLDNGREQDFSRFHLNKTIDALRQLVHLYGKGELKDVEPPANELNISNRPQRYTSSTKDDVVARLRKIYIENDKVTNATTGQKSDSLESIEDKDVTVDVTIEQEIDRMEPTETN
ncbi:uncharacterized protein LOC126845673 isoform X1 [Adelges cooleyi]|uniref:uncharacterized protein LOC126845673 isoform X1 n=1 Tax=Adelges cooleyi TaxID=133065 RepID=UPI0021802AF5|nr:uncharacterized protein LOC126845673 isoform X1 [Adelges cooleyi]